MKRQYRLGRLFFCFTLICTLVVAMSVGVFAKSTNKGVSSTADAEANLQKYVHNQITGNTYELSGGGYITGNDILVPGDNGGYELDENKFQLLTSKAQSQVVSDIAKSSNASLSDSSQANSGITEQTVQNWWKKLQQSNGVGSKFLNTILENTKPDFVTANAIWKPFSGPVGVVLGLIAVMLMSFLGIVMVSDIAYITLPPVRLFVADDENGQKVAKSKIFSHDAIYAVQQAESDSDGGSPKHALGIYLKRRVIMLILLGICLLYLVQGQLYTFVGWVLDLVSGFLGF